MPDLTALQKRLAPIPRTRWTTVSATLVTAALVIASVALARATVHYDDPDISRWAHGLLSRLTWSWILASTAVLALWFVPRRPAIALIIVGGVALQLVAAAVPPRTSDDYYRYAWDGTVQAHGIDPYRHPPAAPELARLREEWLFPTDEAPDPKAAGNADVTDDCTSAGVPHVCTHINRPTVRTIYPPVAQAWFLLLHELTPPRDAGRGLQVGEAMLAVAVTIALLALLRRAGRNPRWAALWAWCPLVWFECGNNAHVEVLGVLFGVLALGMIDLGRPDPSIRRAALVGALFGAAVAAKLLPALAAPALLGRRAVVVAAAAAGVFLAGYIPHVLAVGTAVLGYLPGYFKEEGYNGAIRFGALRLVFPEPIAPWVGAGVLVALAVAVAVTAAGRSAAVGALLLIGTTQAVVGPSQPWYGLLPVSLVALTGRWEWLPVAACGYFVYLAGDLGVNSTSMQERTYLPALLFAGAVTLARLTPLLRSLPATCRWPVPRRWRHPAGSPR